VSKRAFNYYPQQWRQPYLARRGCGWGLYGVLGIARNEKDKMHARHRRSLLFFDAPVGPIFSIDLDLELGSSLDYGSLCNRSWWLRGNSAWKRARRRHS
jgi:hypothetical protein